MLINATQTEEIRVALVNGQTLYDLDLENMEKELLKGNLYLATVKNIEQSLNAAFVDYGAERHGFLPFKEISKEYFHSVEDMAGESSNGNRKNIRDVLKVGQQILIQVDKDERGTKGAALTTFITLAGCYLVLMPNNPRAGGISRRIEGEERDELRDTLEGLKVPEGMGIIVRTAGVGRAPEELQWDLDVLLKRWEDIQNAIATVSAPALIHQERDIIARAIRDHLRDDVDEILIDNPAYFEKAKHYIERLRPESLNRLKLYTDIIPLFSRFQIENQIESAFQRQVILPSGGTLVIDHTEALISIDINSAKATRGHDIEETAFHTNLEAADEIARQLRLRDLGGLIVIDFIDMMATSHQREVENRLREAMRLDRARVQIGRISRFGLLEMSRQRLRSSLSESVQETCPRCSGQGTIRSIESLSLSMIRLIEEEAMKDGTVAVYAALPIDVATFLTNEKRSMLSALETRHGKKVVIMPVVEIQAPNYQIKRIRETDSAAMTEATSFGMAKEMVTRAIEQSSHTQPSRQAPQTPVVQFLADVKPREQSLIQKSVSGISQLFKSVFKNTDKESENTEASSPSRNTAPREESRERERGNRGRYGRRRGGERRERGGERSGERSGERGGERREHRSRQDLPPTLEETAVPVTNEIEAREEMTTDTARHERRGRGHHTRRGLRKDGRAHPHHHRETSPFETMPAPLADVNGDDIDALDIQPANIDHRSPLERQASGQRSEQRDRNHGSLRGGPQRNRRRGPGGSHTPYEQQPERRHAGLPEDTAPRFIPHETPAPVQADVMENAVGAPAVAQSSWEVPAAPVESTSIVAPTSRAPRAPRERKMPKFDSPLMQETTLMDVTKMNAHDEAQASEGAPNISAQETGNEGSAGSVNHRYPRRRANHLRPHRNQNANAVQKESNDEPKGTDEAI